MIFKKTIVKITKLYIQKETRWFERKTQCTWIWYEPNWLYIL